MKKLLAACLLVLSAAPALSEATPYDGPRILGIKPEAAPSGAVIELTIQYDVIPNAPPSLEVEIGGRPAQIIQADKSKIVVIVPQLDGALSSDMLSTNVKARLSVAGTEGADSTDFTLLSSNIPWDHAVNISAVEWESRGTVNVRFDYGIPVALWGKVRIYFDDLPVRGFTRMYPRLFTATLPADLPEKSKYRVVLTLGEAYQAPAYEFDAYVLELDSTPAPSPVPAEQTGFRTIAAPLAAAAALLAISLAFYYSYRQLRLRRSAAASRIVEEDAEQLRLPEDLPPDLVNVCMAGECVLFAGAGLSAQSGLPTWRTFIHGLLEWAVENGFISVAEAASFHAETDRGQADPVADSVVSRLTTSEQQAALNAYLRKVFWRRSSPSAHHAHLKKIKFSAALTTNFDNLLEGLYDTPASQVFTPRNAESLLAALTRREFFILKLYGSLDQPDTVMIAPVQYEDAITGNRLFSQFMETLFFSRTLLFVGASLEGIEAYLRGISLPKDVTRRHYALVAVMDRAWRAKADLLERRYGIRVLPYTPSSNFAELGEFLGRLTEAVEARPDAATPGKQAVSRLKRLSLESIGPFDKLDLELDSSWQIFLGDNGVGKSTVLKAVALALCGEKAQPYAGRLLKGKSESGRITLETDNKTSYVTSIRRNRESGEVEILSTTARPLEAEGWLAIGFPPLRTTSWEPPKGPEADIKTKSRPAVDDLLPLIKGDVDPRLDRLKQWIVNLDYLSIKGEQRNGRYRSLIQKVFDIIGAVAEGMPIEYVGVGEGNRILIKTSDGTDIPLEALSQGVISLIGWIGILMQRLYEVFDQDDDPTQRYALVLMDEIDAHMHPLWQRKLVTHLKETFPEVQFIATTHSPLVVGGMPARQVTRFARDKQGKPVILPIEPAMTLGYTDQILTSDLFGLATTLDDTTETMMNKYDELSQKKDRGGKQEEYEELKRALMARVPSPAPSYDQKREEQLSEAEALRQLGEKLKEQKLEGGQLLLDRAAEMRKIFKGDQGDDSD